MRRVLDAAGHPSAEIFSSRPVGHHSWRMQVTGTHVEFEAYLAWTVCIKGVRLADCSHFYAELEGNLHQVLIIFGYITGPKE